MESLTELFPHCSQTVEEKVVDLLFMQMDILLTTQEYLR